MTKKLIQITIPENESYLITDIKHLAIDKQTSLSEYVKGLIKEDYVRRHGALPIENNENLELGFSYRPKFIDNLDRDKLYTTQEIADIRGVTRQAVDLQIKKSGIKPFSINGRTHLYKGESIINQIK